MSTRSISRSRMLSAVTWAAALAKSGWGMSGVELEDAGGAVIVVGREPGSQADPTFGLAGRAERGPSCGAEQICSRARLPRCRPHITSKFNARILRRCYGFGMGQRGWFGRKVLRQGLRMRAFPFGRSRLMARAFGAMARLQHALRRVDEMRAGLRRIGLRG